MMVMSYGPLCETVRIYNKPIGDIFKILALCDSPHLFRAFPHSNKNPWRDFFYEGIHSPSSSFVATVSNELPRFISVYDGPVQYFIYMEKIFRSLKLLKMMRNKGIVAVGRVRSKHTGFPKCLAIRGRKGVHIDWQHLCAELCEHVAVLALKWIKNLSVQMLTTCHMVGAGQTVERLIKLPRVTYKNWPRFRIVFEMQSTKRLRISKVIDD